MVEFFKECWFGFLLTTIAVLFLAFVAIVSLAPHNDARLRGFAPCTYKMAIDLGQNIGGNRAKAVFEAVSSGYVCYAGVMVQGWSRWLSGKQNTPWENYLFEAETYEIPPELSEPFSEDLLKANRLDEP